MAHTIHDKKKLLNRVRRVRGQLDAVEKSLEQERPCDIVLQNVVACRGAINALMAEILEGHVREHVLDGKQPANGPQADAADQLMAVIRTYLK